MSEEGDIYNTWKEMLNAEFKLDKIIELEKKFEHQCDNCQILMQDRVKEIAELRLRLETLKVGEDDDIKEIDIFRKQITELKEQMYKSDKLLEKNTEKNYDQIAELKEQIKIEAINLNVGQVAESNAEIIINLTEVLREVKDNMLKHRLLPSNFDEVYKLDGEKTVKGEYRKEILPTSLLTPSKPSEQDLDYCPNCGERICDCGERPPDATGAGSARQTVMSVDEACRQIEESVSFGEKPSEPLDEYKKNLAFKTVKELEKEKWEKRRKE